MFVAVLPPHGVLEDLEEYVAPRREAGGPRWTPPEQWHLTLAFLPDVPDAHLDALADGLAAAAVRRTPFGMRVAGGGAFPDPTRARVLYAALDPQADTGADTGAETGADTGAEELDRLARGARNAANAAGVEVDGQRFRPHLTLARMNRPTEATRWIRVFDAYAGPAWQVEEVALVASYLGEAPGGRARHEVVGRFSLGPAGSGPAPAGAPPCGR